MDLNHTADTTGVDPLGMARRHWWLVLLLIVLGVAGAVQFTRMQTKVYESSTSVLVMPTGGGSDTNVAGGCTKGDINLDTEAQLVASTAVASSAGELLHSAGPADRLAANVTVSVPANTSVLVITYSAPTARGAQSGSHAFAEAYLKNRQNSAESDLAQQIATLNDKVTQLNGQLAAINSQLAPLKGSDPDRANLDSQRSTVANQINSLSSRVNQLATTTVTAGRIIRDAEVPAAPVKPNRPINLASGAMIGLVLGVGGALLRERLDKRVRRASDLRRLDVPVIAAIPNRVRPRLDDVFAPFGTGGRVFNRLRNEVLASAPAPAAGDTRAALGGQVVVVAGASRGASSTVVAVNLAAAFARTSAETVLVCAHLPDNLVDTASMHRMLGVRSIPGLSVVLAGRVSLSCATQRAPRHPSLSIITTGGTASAGGLLQSQTLREVLATLRERAAYVVVEAPSTATSADAQSLASLADAALIAVELRRTRFAEVTDAADQLRRVGTPLLGAVVVPKPTPVQPVEVGDEDEADEDTPESVLSPALFEALEQQGDIANDETIVTRKPSSHAVPVKRRPKTGTTPAPSKPSLDQH